jgi:citrate synthase
VVTGFGRLPTPDQLDRFDRQLRQHRRVKYNIRDIMKASPVTGHPMEMLQTAVASLGMFYPNDVPVQIRIPGDESDQYVHGQSIRILARMGWSRTRWWPGSWMSVLSCTRNTPSMHRPLQPW